MGISELQSEIVRISPKTLSKELEALEENEIIARSLYDRIPVSVEYSLTLLHLDKFISPETILCNELAALKNYQTSPFSVVLPGGEPLSLGSARLEFILGNLIRVLSDEFPISIQTNGILISDKILDVCSKHHTSIAVSIGGPKDVHDKFRVTHNEGGTFEDVMKGIERLKKHKDSAFLNASIPTVTNAHYNFVKHSYSFGRLVTTHISQERIVLFRLAGVEPDKPSSCAIRLIIC